jgi:hypothetical protein
MERFAMPTMLDEPTVLDGTVWTIENEFDPPESEPMASEKDFR